MTIGDPVVNFRGEKGHLVGWRPPVKINSTGRIYVRLEGQTDECEWYPSVCGLKIVEG